MNPLLLEKLGNLELSMSRDNGDFELFGVFLREDSPERWDLIVAASWLDPDKLESFKVLAGALKATLTREELLGFSRIVILEKSNPFLETVLAMASNEHGLNEFVNMTISGVSIRRAYILTAKRRPVRKRRRNRNGTSAK